MINDFSVDEHAGYAQLFQSWLDEITYKPNWQFHIGMHGIAGDGSGFLTIAANVMDSETMTPTVIYHGFYLPPVEVISDHDMFIEYVFQLVRSIELHEAMEFFKVNGKRHKDPHPSSGMTLYG